MGEQRLLDVYEAAFLAGGPDRVVDTALVALVETGRVRVQRTGELRVVDDRPGHEVEAAVLAAIGQRGWRQVDLVRWKAGQDERFTALAERLRRDGLISFVGAPQRLARWRGPVALTAAGRRTVRELRADPAVTGVAAGTSAARVALRGTGQMPDREQRNAVFHPPGPRRRWRRGPRPGGASGAAASADGTRYSAAGGSEGFIGGGGYGCGGHGGGGHGCGGHGCGGAGCGGGGCGG